MADQSVQQRLAAVLAADVVGYQIPISPFVRIAGANAHVKRLTERIELVNRIGG